MDPLVLLKDELYSNDIEVVLSALRCLEAVGLALGTQRSASELLPFLVEFAGANAAIEAANVSVAGAGGGGGGGGGASSTSDKDPGAVNTDRVIPDEALSVLGENLGSLASPALAVDAGVIIPLLEVLCKKDETCVREAAVRGTAALIADVPQLQIIEVVLPMVERLASHEWFSARCSAAQLLTPLYERVPDDPAKASLRTMMASLCKDDTPMVRKASFIELSKLCAVVGATFLRSDLVMSLRALCEDEQDSVRIFIVDCSLSIAKAVDDLNFQELALPLIEEASGDTSWRVRRHLSRNLFDLMEAIDKDSSLSSLVPILVRLLGDSEAEVRIATIKNLVRIVHVVGEQRITQHIVPTIRSIAHDSADPARMALSECISDLCENADPAAVKSELLPIVIDLLQDELAEVRLNVLENIHKIGKVVGMELLVSSIQPMIESMTIDQKWRIRSGVFSQIASFTKEAGVAVYEKNYHEILFRGLNDTVYEVRKICAAQVGAIVENFGGEWAQKSLLPEALKMFDVSSNYLHRIVPLQIISSCASHFDQAYVANTLLPVVLTGCKDTIANVRICAARTMEKIVPCLDPVVLRESVKPILQRMKDDSDPDVKYFSEKALLTLK